MNSATKALVIAVFSLASCTNQVIPAATPTINTVQLSFYATHSTEPLLSSVTREYAQQHPNVILEVGAGRNFDTLSNLTEQGKIPLFLANHLPADSTLWAAPVGQDGLAIIQHVDNQSVQLSLQQIREIYQGRIANWVEVGGTDVAIQVISREDGAGARAEFNKLIMGETQTISSALVAPSSAAMLERVTEIPGSIGYISMAQLSEGVQTIPVDGVLPTVDSLLNNTYPLRSTLFAVALTEPDEGVYRELVIWMQSPEGQAVVAMNYAPLLPQ